MTNLVKSISKSQGTHCSLAVVILFGKISGYIHLHQRLVSDAKAFLWTPDVFGILGCGGQTLSQCQVNESNDWLKDMLAFLFIIPGPQPYLAYREGDCLLNLKWKKKNWYIHSWKLYNHTLQLLTILSSLNAILFFSFFLFILKFL